MTGRGIENYPGIMIACPIKHTEISLQSLAK